MSCAVSEAGISPFLAYNIFLVKDFKRNSSILRNSEDNIVLKFLLP